MTFAHAWPLWLLPLYAAGLGFSLYVAFRKEQAG